MTSVPPAVEMNGCRGTEVKRALSQLASRKSIAITALNGKPNLTLVRANVRAILVLSPDHIRYDMDLASRVARLVHCGIKTNNHIDPSFDHIR